MSIESVNRYGIKPTRTENFPQWFQAVVAAAELAELDHVRGCMVIRPWGYGAWELMRDALDREILLRPSK
jgi:prolyl-tRNA synthetase